MVKNRPTVALFGGSFDPPHKGHQAIVKRVAALEDIDHVIVMPAFLNPFKRSTLAPAQKRLEWCRKVCRGDKVIVSDFEIAMKRPVYTIQTLEMLQKMYTVKYLVIGADNLAQIESWKQFDLINAQVTWLVFTRDGAVPDCHTLRDCQLLALDIPASSTAIRKGDDLKQVDGSILNEVKDISSQSINQYKKDKDDHKRES